MEDNRQLDNNAEESKDIDDFLAQASLDIFVLTSEDVDDMVERMSDLDGMPEPQYTRRHKLRMNRLFRERVGGSFLPFPEVDNAFERIRSKIVIKIKLNEFLDRRQKRRLSKSGISRRRRGR